MNTLKRKPLGQQPDNGCNYYSYQAYPTQATARETPSVAVVVIGWNTAEFLASCLDSVLNQTHAPNEVVYVDDASSDNSVAVAKRFEAEGFKVIVQEQNAGMCLARMRGVAETTSSLLLFVDSDNVLPPDYLATMLEDLGSHAFVYPNKKFFGRGPRMDRQRKFFPKLEWTPQEADRAFLWDRNYADTCSLVRRSALLNVGGWQNSDANTMQDWSLFLRLSAIGTHARSRAWLHYRIHGGNWSEKERGDCYQTLAGKVRKDAATITVATVYSGRMPGLFVPWLQAITASLLAANKTAEILILDASLEGLPPLEWSPAFSAVNVRRATMPADAHKRRLDRYATATFLAGAFNELLRVSSGDVLWTVEDDTIVPVDACRRMLHELLGWPKVQVAVGACYKSRHHPIEYVAAYLVEKKVVHIRSLEDKAFPVHFTGTGCLMLLKDKLDGKHWTAEWNHNGLRSPAHDWTLAWELHKSGTPVIMVPSVVCRHHQSETVFV